MINMMKKGKDNKSNLSNISPILSKKSGEFRAKPSANLMFV